MRKMGSASVFDYNLHHGWLQVNMDKLCHSAPVADRRSRTVVAQDAVKRATVNNPYLAHNSNKGAETARVAASPGKLGSVLNLFGRRSFGRVSKRHRYGHSPRPASSDENLDKRYHETDTPRTAQSDEQLDKRYKYVGTPRQRSTLSVEQLDR